jgi:hypothetical protein
VGTHHRTPLLAIDNHRLCMIPSRSEDHWSDRKEGCCGDVDARFSDGIEIPFDTFIQFIDA